MLLATVSMRDWASWPAARPVFRLPLLSAASKLPLSWTAWFQLRSWDVTCPWAVLTLALEEDRLDATVGSTAPPTVVLWNALFAALSCALKLATSMPIPLKVIVSPAFTVAARLSEASVRRLPVDPSTGLVYVAFEMSLWI